MNDTIAGGVVIPIVPVPKPRMTRSDRWKQRPAVVRYHKFCDQLRSLVAGTPEPTFEIIFYMPMPSSWSKKKQATMVGKPHQQKPDVDNLLKAYLDALCVDDSYVWDVRVKKFWWVAGCIVIRESK